MLYMFINMVLVVAQISFGVTNFREAQRWKVNLLVTQVVHLSEFSGKYPGW